MHTHTLEVPHNMSDYPIVYRSIENFDKLDLKAAMRGQDCNVYADPNIRIVDKRLGIAAVREKGFGESIRLSVETTHELPEVVEFPVEELMVQTNRNGTSVIGLKTDVETVARIQHDRFVASRIFGIAIISDFDMLALCTVRDNKQLKVAENIILQQLLGADDPLILSPPTLKILKSR